MYAALLDYLASTCPAVAVSFVDIAALATDKAVLAVVTPDGRCRGHPAMYSLHCSS